MVRNSVPFVLRPFEGLPGEPDWVALREVVPAATATARTNADHGARDVVVATVLPSAWPAVHRADGTLLVGLQTHAGSGDASRDVAAALLAAMDTEPGAVVEPPGLPEPGPRLQDVLDESVPFEVTVHDGFDFWLSPGTEVTGEISASLEQANAGALPTVRLDGVEAAYWCDFGAKQFLRWAQPYDEDKLLDAMARLHARREAAVAEGSRFVGAFRSCGIVVPVWELAPGTEAAELEQPALSFAAALADAVAVEQPLDAAERRARAGIVSRQLTLR